MCSTSARQDKGTFYSLEQCEGESESFDSDDSCIEGYSSDVHVSTAIVVRHSTLIPINVLFLRRLSGTLLRMGIPSLH